MYRHAVAVVTATSAAALLATAAPAIADDPRPEPAAQCSNHDLFSINVSPPPPLAGTVTADDIRGLMDTIVAGSRLQGFFSAGAGAPAVPAVPYVPYVMPWGAARYAAPYEPQHALPGQPLNGATYQPGAGDGADTGQPGVGGAVPSQPGYGGPSPSLSASANPSPSAAPSSSASASASAAPSTSASAAPSGSVSTVPSGSASTAPSLAPAPLNAGEASVSPVQAMFEDLIGRALECARATAAPGTEVPPMPDIDTSELARYLETLVTNLPASCVTAASPSTGASTGSSAGSPAAGAASPAQSPATLLDAIGVSQILSTLASYPALCAGTVSTGGTSTSLLDSIGVTSLFKSLTG
ncbi:hypothetical protein [Nonomuraea rubra]|uniref:hypothetical protein n=1 Tax=Nonomuraea rubra TaxID=46180 RepID=UPI0033D1C8E1